MNYKTAFGLVDQLLTQWQSLIHFRPFHDTAIPAGITCEQQQLLTALNRCDAEQLPELEQNNEQLLALIHQHAPDFAQQLGELCNFERSLQRTRNQQNLSGVDRFFNVGIPGRKWQQIQNFVESIPPITNPIVDWCSGKGHLARLLHQRHGQPVTCLEYDQQLCRDGTQLAQQQRIDVQFLEQDVLQPLPATLPTNDCHYTALHACGDLHLALLKNAASTPIAGLSLSPCCYQKTRHRVYKPLSTIAGASSLRLSRENLALAVAETVTGGARIKRLRHQERLWRVAFDIWQKQQCGEHSVLHLPSLPKRLLNQPFAEFCHWATSEKQRMFAIPDAHQQRQLLHDAEQKLLHIRRLELVQQPLKRPLELWLILDRVLFLQEHQFDCQLSLFCERATSPRNFLIQATKV